MPFKKKKRSNRDMGKSTLETPIDPHNFRCTYCGTRMQQKTEEDIYGRGEGVDFMRLQYLLCPKCGAYCRTRKSNSKKVYLMSTPADKQTRLARIEAHYYFNMLYKYKVLPDRDTAYNWLSGVFGVAVIAPEHRKHIGELEKWQCEKVIVESLKKILENAENLKRPVFPYELEYGETYTSRNSEVRELIEKINKKCPAKARAKRIEEAGGITEFSEDRRKTGSLKTCDNFLCGYLSDDICKNSLASNYEKICSEGTECEFSNNCIACIRKDNCSDRNSKSLIDKTELKEDLEARIERDNNNSRWLDDEEARQDDLDMQLVNMMRRFASGKEADENSDQR